MRWKGIKEGKWCQPLASSHVCIDMCTSPHSSHNYRYIHNAYNKKERNTFACQREKQIVHDTSLCLPSIFSSKSFPALSLHIWELEAVSTSKLRLLVIWLSPFPLTYARKSCFISCTKSIWEQSADFSSAFPNHVSCSASSESHVCPLSYTIANDTWNAQPYNSNILCFQLGMVTFSHLSGFY